MGFEAIGCEAILLSSSSPLVSRAFLAGILPKLSKSKSADLSLAGDVLTDVRARGCRAVETVKDRRMGCERHSLWAGRIGPTNHLVAFIMNYVRKQSMINIIGVAVVKVW